MMSENAKADAAAEKARAKAMRPWWKKKRYNIPLATVVLIAVVAVASAGGGDAELAGDTDGGEEVEEPADEADDGDGGQEEAERAAVGEPAEDGQFTFTVQKIDCGQQTIGEEPMTEEAQGQWCILTATVENTGDEARGLSASNQYLYDVNDRQFEASLPMAVADETPIFEDINPGNSVEGRFYFDVGDDFEASHVELHDSALSGGVIVDLEGEAS